MMSFKITPRSRPGAWANIIHFTTGGNCCKFGERSPAIWLHPNMFLHIRLGDTRDGNWGFDSQSIPLNQTTTVTLNCQGKNVLCSVNERTFSFNQPTSRPTGPMIVYGSDPWHQPANCTISEFCLQIL
jgi:hypothetical protein